MEAMISLIGANLGTILAVVLIAALPVFIGYRAIKIFRKGDQE